VQLVEGASSLMLPVGLGADADRPLRILCLGAHSDDIEIGCGGTVLRLLAERAGTSVHWVVFSAPGPREQEARSSAAAFLSQAAASTIWVRSFRESYFPAAWSEIKDFFEEIRASVDPDLVLCHRREDLHQDHRVIAELTWNTFRNHLLLEYEIPKYEGDLGTPNLFVPLSRQHAERKVELLLQHFVSQAGRIWFRPDTFHGLMSVRGVECHAPEGRAEAFHARKIVV
jgi:LmbE family N-acetylglucosaminyl deacetylase